MASTLRNVVADLLVALRKNHTHYDLRTTSDTERVVVGEYDSPPISGVPFLALRIEKVTSNHEDHAHLGQYDSKGEIGFIGWVPTESSSPSERALDAADLASDVIRAVQVAHADTVTYTTVGQLVVLVGEVLGIYGDGANLPDGWGVVEGVVRYETIVSGGV